MKPLHTLAFILAFGFGLQSQCLNPTNFTGQNITTTSVDIDLSASGSGPWDIEYGALGFTIGSGTTLISTNSIITLSNLSPGSSYRVYIRRKCGVQFSGRASFTFNTACGTIVNAPVKYSFDGAAWQSPTNTIGLGNMATCWIVSPQGTNTFWSVGPSHETHLSTGPAGDHSTGYSKFLHLNGQGISQDSSSSVQSPAIDLQGLNHPQLEFWYHLYGAQIDSLEVMVKMSSTINWDTLHTFYGQQQTSQEAPWQKQRLSLSSFLDSVINIQFVAYGKGTDVQMAIDDLSVHDSLACRPSSYFRNSSNNHQSVLLDWDPGTGTSFQIEYGFKGFSQGSGTLLNVGGAPYRISGLNPDTTYDFYLRDNCGPNQYSNWTGPLEVVTDCSPQFAPYFTDFEGSDWPNGGLEACWDRFNYLDFKWQVGPPSLNYVQSGPGPNNHTPGGSQFIVADRPNQKGNARSSITSPIIDLDTITNPELIFWSHMFGLHITAFDIEVDSGDGFVRVKRIIGSQQLSKSAPWTEQIIALPSYAGKQVKVKFTAIASSNWSSLARIGIDDFYIGEAPPCRKPTNLVASEVKFNSARIDWLSGGATNWLYKLKVNGGAATISPTNSNPLDLNQLQPGTEYTVWVKDSCGQGLSSDWSAAVTFRTYCLPDTAPYFQDFEDSQFQVQSSWFSTGTMHPCWSRSNELGPIWQPSPASILPNNLLPTQDHTSGSGKYIGGSLFLGNGTNQATSFTSPHIDLSGLSSPEMSFWYFLGGWSFSSNQIQVEVSNGSSWQNVTTIFGPTQLSTSDSWLEKIVDLSAYAGDTIQLRFISLGNNLYAATAGGIDDVHIYDNPICSKPSNLRAHYVRTNSAALAWTTGGASNWIVRYKAQGEGFQFKAAAQNDTFNLDSLQAATRYEIWVRDSCGSIVSGWHGPIYIYTDCIATSVPYYEGFDGSIWRPSAASVDPGIIDNCWRRSDTVEKVWIPKTGGSSSPFSGPSATRSGSGNYMMTEILFSPAQPGNLVYELRSPVIANVGLQQPELNFWYHLYGPQIQKLLVYIEKLDESRVLVDSIIGQQQTSKTAAWQQKSIPLTNFNGDTLKVVFEAYTGNIPGRVNVAIDDVEIIDAICGLPSNLGVSNISMSAARLNWQSISVRSNVQYGLAGFNLGSGTQLNNVTSGQQINGLQPFTTYEFYVQDSCRLSNSAWVGPFSFTTSCAAPTAAFSGQNNALSVSFDGSSSLGTGLNYSWNFGDGNTGSGLNPQHQYAMAGTYTVSLLITDTCGLQDSINQSILVCDAPQASITYSRQGLSVRFDGRFSTGASQYLWNLGPAGIFTTDTPTAVFPSKGNYSIYLVVTNACGDKDTLFLNLNICDKPTASFTATITTIGNPFMMVSFDGTASVFADSFTWDFGDGSQDTSTLTPIHLYASSTQNYTVKLITVADCGLADTMVYSLNPISLKEWESKDLKVYPNPAQDRINLSTSDRNLNPETFRWFNSSGQEFQVPLLSKEELHFEFDVSHLAAGEYFLLINAAGLRYSVKINIQ